MFLGSVLCAKNSGSSCFWVLQVPAPPQKLKVPIFCNSGSGFCSSSFRFLVLKPENKGSLPVLISIQTSGSQPWLRVPVPHWGAENRYSFNYRFQVPIRFCFPVKGFGSFRFYFLQEKNSGSRKSRKLTKIKDPVFSGSGFRSLKIKVLNHFSFQFRVPVSSLVQPATSPSLRAVQYGRGLAEKMRAFRKV